MWVSKELYRGRDPQRVFPVTGGDEKAQAAGSGGLVNAGQGGAAEEGREPQGSWCGLHLGIGRRERP